MCGQRLTNQLFPERYSSLIASPIAPIPPWFERAARPSVGISKNQLVSSQNQLVLDWT
jgi:hypothetical protein